MYASTVSVDWELRLKLNTLVRACRSLLVLYRLTEEPLPIRTQHTGTLYVPFILVVWKGEDQEAHSREKLSEDGIVHSMLHQKRKALFY